MALSRTYNEVLYKQASLIVQKINENVQKVEWNCLHPDCTLKAINSHLLQRRGILNHISENNMVVQFLQTGAFESEKDSNKYIFKTRTVNQALSLPLFCKEHDSNLFREIEQGEIDFLNYEAQLLFSYRAVCSEIRRKNIIIEANQRALNSKILSSIGGVEYHNELNHDILINQWGLKDLNRTKVNFERDLHQNSNSFVFKVYKYSPLGVCTSAIFTPFQVGEDDFIYEHDLPFPSCFISIIPQKDSSFLIVGYNKEYVNDWIISYIEELNTEDKLAQELLISNLFATRINTFAMSKSTYNKINKAKLKSFLDYWNVNFLNTYTNQLYSENLFEK